MHQGPQDTWNLLKEAGYMTASVPRRGTNDFSLTSTAGPYMANSIRPFTTHCAWPGVALLASVEESIAEISVELMVGREVFEQSVDYQERSKSASC